MKLSSSLLEQALATSQVTFCYIIENTKLNSINVIFKTS